jgi:hypothetical protein
MRPVLCGLIVVLALLRLGAGSAAAQDNALEKAEALAQQASQLERQGRYDDAIPLTSEALAIREKALGPEHPPPPLTNLRSTPRSAEPRRCAAPKWRCSIRRTRRGSLIRPYGRRLWWSAREARDAK